MSRIFLPTTNTSPLIDSAHPHPCRESHIYARKGRSGPTHLFVTYKWCRDVVVETDTPFEPWRAGSVSGDVVEVIYDVDARQLSVRDPADMSDFLR